MMKPPLTSEKALKALQTLSEKSTSKSWINPIADEDAEIIADAVKAASAMTAQVNSWNEVHHHTADMFRQIVSMFNDTIIFGEEPSEEEAK